MNQTVNGGSAVSLSGLHSIPPTRGAVSAACITIRRGRAWAFSFAEEIGEVAFLETDILALDPVLSRLEGAYLSGLVWFLRPGEGFRVLLSGKKAFVHLGRTCSAM
jgi:hypothetical protein